MPQQEEPSEQQAITGRDVISRPVVFSGRDAFKRLGAMNRMDPLQFWLETAEGHGDTIRFKLPFMDIWFFASPQAIHEVMVTRHRSMRKGIGYRGLRKLLGEGMITTDKPHWNEQRASLNPIFAPRSINTHGEAIHAACQAGIEELDTLAGSAAPVDIGHAMTRLTMRVISRAAFGVDLADEYNEVAKAFEFAFAFVADITLEPLRLPLFVPTAKNRKFAEACRVIDRFVEELISLSGDRRSAGPSQQADMSASIFAALQGNDRKLLRDEIVSLYFAGFETTARTMTFLMDVLGRNRDILEKLRDEAIQARPYQGGAFPLQDYPAAVEVVNEALRLYPPVAMLARQANEDCTIAGHGVRRNAMIIICPYLAQRDEAFWPSGGRFAPDFERPLAARLAHRGAFIPFGAGPRLCLGKNFALQELAMATTMIAGRYDWKPVKDDPPQFAFHGSLRPAEPVMAMLTRV